MCLAIKFPFLILAVALCVAMIVTISWATTLTPGEVKNCKMWIRLAINGYSEPMKQSIEYLPGE